MKLGVLLLLVLVEVFVYSMLKVEKDNNESSYQPSLVENVVPTITIFPTATPTPTPIPIGSDTWVVNLPKYEIQTTDKLTEKNLIYAIKNEFTSTVYKRNLENGSQVKLFEFEEEEKANSKSRNYWESQPASIALAPNKYQIAYTDNAGLTIYNLNSGNRKVLIKKLVVNNENTDWSPAWSIKDVKDTYALIKPLWSFDSKYISFEQSHLEGAGLGLINLGTGSYSQISRGSNLTWSMSNLRYIIPHSMAAFDGYGLEISGPNDIRKAINLGLKFDKDDVAFYEANFSLDGKKIALTYSPTNNKSQNSMGVVNVDGSNFLTINERSWNSMPFFDNKENIFYIQDRGKKQVLRHYKLDKAQSYDLVVLPDEYDEWSGATWTKEGYLYIQASVRSSDKNADKEKTTRLIILDLQNQRVIYASPPYNIFTTFAGLMN